MGTSVRVGVERGFFVAEKGRGPVYIVPHSGPLFIESEEARDTNADRVASLCWEKSGGAIILSTIPRSRDIGIDFNRGIPDIRVAVAGMGKRDASYMNRYGWWALDRKDYANRLSIYRDFWETAKSLGSTFLLIHALACRLANFPSIMDIITFNSKGYSRDNIRDIADRLNRKYSGFFRDISSPYKENTLLANKIHIKETLSRRKNWLQREFFKKEIDVINRFSDKALSREMQGNLGRKTFLAAAGSALKRGGPPRITVEEKFSGKKAFGPRENLLGEGRKVLEIELNIFLSFYHPEKARDIILDIIKRI